jgi:diguanylate cyclase (GGDEF)-like protein
VALDVGLKRFLHLKVSHERDAMRAILDRVIADNFDGVVVIGENGIILAASRFAEDVLGNGLTGREAREALPAGLERTIRAALDDRSVTPQAEPAEMVLHVGAAEPRTIEYAITLSEVKELGGHSEARTRWVACLTFRDVTERRQKDARLRYLVSHDYLTGAWSRLKLIQMMDGLMGDDRSRAEGISVVLVDLGRFKAINDTLGHGYGDMVLKQVVGRIRACGVEAVARLGGDSFAIAFPGALAPPELERFCLAIIARVTQTYTLEDNHHAIVAAGAGATTSDMSGYDPQILLSHADMALSAAKSKPGSNIALFTPDMDERLKRTQDMETALRRAIERDELTLTYQPQVDLESGDLVGVEALVRWERPEFGPVSPALFIPAAEETGQIVELGRFVMRTACTVAARWPADIKLAVNVSPIQFELVDVAQEVAQALSISGLPASRLDLEITEGLFMSRDDNITHKLERIRRMGVGIALDDFGTGYSSLSYLGRLPVDKIKIDQSFVRSLPGNQESGAIVRAVMTLSETLNKVVVAEGIENADQAWMLRILGCRIGQGYHFGRPKTEAEVEAMLAEADGGPVKALAG